MNAATTFPVIDLAGAWSVQRSDGAQPAIPAIVPGCVHTDQQRAGQLPALFWRDNELQYLDACTRDWTWRREFTVDAAFLRHRRIELRCDGLDTFATVRINGTQVLDADNMFRTWRVDVARALKAGTNTIEVAIRSPLPYMEARNRERVLPQWNTYHASFASRGYVRKMACAFGWDWGPMVPTAGIWKGIAIEARDSGRLAGVRIAQAHRAGAVDLTVHAQIAHGEGCTVRSTVSFGGATVASGAGTLTISNPQLWWCNGMGAQPLYAVLVELVDAAGAVVDRWSGRIGLRTIALLRESDQWGESFAFVINGKRIFSKGANWIPSSIFPHECGGDLCRRSLRDAFDAGMNMIRAWGGGIYESDVFYDTCDELGILVWQDCMFACGAYPGFDAAFLASVRAEMTDNARRLRNHPSLALWCGNNELEQGFGGDEWSDKTMSWVDYDAIFGKAIPQTLAAEDPATPYWPASPHSPHGDRRDFNNHRWGDAHAWSVWFGDQSFESQRTWLYRFQSEFGFQSFPEPRTVEAFTEPADRNLTSYIMDLHQRSKSKGNGQIFRYLLDWFRMPKDFASSLWLTQLTQALCVQYAAEHTRRMQPRIEGCLYWQINDMWPAATWSSVDCFGRWKALQHLAKRFFAPVLVSGLENTRDSTVEVHLSNHLPQDLQATVSWRATDTSGRELASGSAPASVASQTDGKVLVIEAAALRTRLGSQPVHGDAPKPEGSLGMYRGDLDLLIWLEASAGGQVLSRNLVLFARPKHLALREPAIACAVADAGNGAFAITLTAQAPALWTRLELDGVDARFDDNWIHLDGRSATTVRCTPSGKLTLAEVQAKVRATSLIGH